MTNSTTDFNDTVNAASDALNNAADTAVKNNRWGKVKKTAIGLGIGAVVVGVGYGVSRLVGGAASSVGDVAGEAVESLLR